MTDATQPLTIIQDATCPEWRALLARVLTPRVALPKPIGDRGILPPDKMAARVQAHKALRSSLQRLAAYQQEDAA